MGAVDFNVDLKAKIAPDMKSAPAQILALERAMKSLEQQATKAAAIGNVNAIQRMSAQYKMLGAQVGMLKDEFGSLAPAVDPPVEKIGMLEKAMGMAGKKMAALGGPVGIAIAVITALAAASVAAALALGALVVKGAQLAISMGELREKTLATFAAYTQGQAGAEALINTLDGLRGSLGMTREELTPLTQKLLQMGVKASDVAGQLTALASIRALGIEGGEEKYLSLLKKVDGGAKVAAKSILDLYEASGLKDQLGTGVEKLAKQLKAGQISATEFQRAIQAAVTAKGADALAVQANSLSATWARLKENFFHLFESVNIKPFLAQVKDLASLFDRSTASGSAMKMGITNALNAVFSVATKVIPYIKVGFLYLIVLALKVAVALRPLVSHFQAMWSAVGGASAASASLKYFAFSVEVLGYMALDTVKAIVWLSDAVMDTIAVFARGGEAAHNFVKGLADGITSGVGIVIDAIKGLGASAITALKSVLKIKSPSLVMHQMGVYTSQGLAEGMSAGAAQVQASAEEMGGAVAPAVAKGASGGNVGSAGRTVTITVAPGAVVITGAGSSGEALTMTEAALASIFEKLAISQGLGAPA